MAGGPALGVAVDGDAVAGSASAGRFLTDAANFVDVSRGNPKPSHAQGRGSVKGPAHAANLAARDRGRRIVPDGSAGRLEDGTRSTWPAQRAGEVARRQVLEGHAVQQHPVPAGPGALGGRAAARGGQTGRRVGNVRRVYYWGFHNDDPAQLFQSSLSYNRVMETPPWEPPPLVAYRLNGRGYSPGARGARAHGGAVGTRLQVDQVAAEDRPDQRLSGQRYVRPPEQRSRIVLEDGRLHRQGHRNRSRPASRWSSRERPWSAGRGSSGSNSGCGRRRRRTKSSSDDDPAWKTAVWKPCELMPPPDDWQRDPAAGNIVQGGLGLRPRSGKPKDWPLLSAWSRGPRGCKGSHRDVRVPRPHRRPEWLRPARAAAIPEIGYERGAESRIGRDGLRAGEQITPALPVPSRLNREAQLPEGFDAGEPSAFHVQNRSMPTSSNNVARHIIRRMLSYQ